LPDPEPGKDTLLLLAPGLGVMGRVAFLDVDGVVLLIVDDGEMRALLAAQPAVRLVFGMENVVLPTDYAAAEALVWRQGTGHWARLIPSASSPTVVLRAAWRRIGKERVPLETVPSVGEVLRVRTEEHDSIVVGSRRDCSISRDRVPDIDFCCVPAVLVRTPAADGLLRWVPVEDLNSALSVDAAVPS
jgi:hypothetical protein